MPTTNIEAGKVYVGEHNTRRLVVSTDGGVTFAHMPSLQQETVSLTAFSKWAQGEWAGLVHEPTPFPE